MVERLGGLMQRYVPFFKLYGYEHPCNALLTTL
jgi:hypothetical protein